MLQRNFIFNLGITRLYEIQKRVAALLWRFQEQADILNENHLPQS